MLRFASTPEQHTVELLLLETVDLPHAQDDVRLQINVESHGFTGSTDVWVLREEVQSFARDLAKLNSTLSGHAAIRSISPGELDLTIRSVSSRGHMAAQGTIGYQVYERERMYWHSVSFGFEFEPQQLEAAVREPWVAQSAA